MDLPKTYEERCPTCHGQGFFERLMTNFRERRTCPTCLGHRTLPRALAQLEKRVRELRTLLEAGES